jgi:TonB family protein
MRQTVSLFLMTLLAAAAPALAFQTPQAAAAPGAFRVSGQTKAPERIKYVAPVYPAAAADARISGIVIVEATVGKDGSVTEAHVIRSIAQLDQAALDAVKQWKYTPTTLNGAPVPVIVTATVNFTPPGVQATTAPAGRAVAPAATPTPQAADTPARHAVDPRIDQSDVNIKMVVKITDTSASSTQTKIVSVIMANRGNGRVRSQGSTSSPNTSTKAVELNVDARATLFKSGAISTNMTVNYTPEWSDETMRFSGVSQSVDLYLKDGVPTVVTQAADPTRGSRSITIEVTATVVK